MELLPKKPSTKGPGEFFTGDVLIDAIARGQEPSRIRVNAVHFTPGARTAWHSHVLGQTLITEGAGGAERPETNWGDHVTDAQYDGRKR
jgi:quercetin dioxygenase-like cupin family protein